MADEPTITLQIDASPEVRAGVFSDLALMATKGNVTRIDFVLTDGMAEPTGVIASRVFMANEDLVALRDALIHHTQEWVVQEVKPNAE